ncbi:tRNA (adenosine(37)-N6)-threonylcarbamoyltransferase complex dimerization subunit type 1 TsaB [Chloroflexota bacterium]
MELAIDTATGTASIALSSQGKVLAELTWHAGQNHTAELMPNLTNLLHRSGVTVKELSALIVAKGPGSFNGLRVGVSTAKGLAFALGIPVVGISTLEVIAYPYAVTAQPVCPILGAGRGEIAAALFQRRRGSWQQLFEEQITTVELLVSRIKGKTIFCGEISPEVASEIKERLGKSALIADGAAGLRRAGYLAELGWHRLKEGDTDDPATLQPLYLRKPAITTPRSGRLGMPEGKQE